MGSKKSRLARADALAVTKAAEAAARLLARSRSPAPGPVRLTVEDEDSGPWDDLVEWPSLDQRDPPLARWQIRSHDNRMPWGEFEELLKRAPECGELCLGLRNPAVSIRKPGMKGRTLSLTRLGLLCDKCRELGADYARYPTTEDQSWLALLRDLLASEEDVKKLLRRLYVKVLGERELIERAGIEALKSMGCIDPVSAFARLYKFIGSNPSGYVDITSQILDKVLAGLLPEATPSPRQRPEAVVRSDVTGMPLPQTDRSFIGRDKESDVLNAWTRDPRTMLGVVEGVPGIGKSALIAKWLPTSRDDAFPRAFYWDAREAPNANQFLAALDRELGTPMSEIGSRGNALRRALEAGYLVVLDGLDGSLDSAFEPILTNSTALPVRGKLLIACEAAPQWALAGLGSWTRLLSLGGLQDEDIDVLLAASRRSIPPQEMRDCARRLLGHPMALRLLASIPIETPVDVLAGLTDLLQGSAEESRLTETVGRFIDYCYRTMTPEQRRIIISLSLLPGVSDEGEIVPIAAILPQEEGTLLPGPGTESSPRELLNDLEARGLVARIPVDKDATRWTVHPLIRDRIRVDALAGAPDIAKRMAGLVPQAPLPTLDAEANGVMLACNAIELLLMAGYMREAFCVFQERLQHGKLLKTAPAVHRGLRCVKRFVDSDESRRRVEQDLPPNVLPFLLGETALLADLAGNMKLSRRYHEEAVEARRAQGAGGELATTLENFAEHLADTGNVGRSLDVALDAEQIARSTYAKTGGNVTIEQTLSCCWASLARIADLLDLAAEARGCFDVARACDSTVEMFTGVTMFASVPGVRRTSLFHRLGETSIAYREALERLKMSEQARHMDDIARWCTVSGEILRFTDPTAAEEHLQRAEGIVRAGGHLRELPQILIARAEVSLGQGQLVEAYSLVDEAVSMSAAAGLRIHHVAALLMRGRVLMADAEKAGAGRLPGAVEDIESALRLASEAPLPRLRKEALQRRLEIADLQGDTRSADHARVALMRRERENGVQARGRAEIGRRLAEMSGRPDMRLGTLRLTWIFTAAESGNAS